MNRTMVPAPIRKTVEVRASPQKAFRVFTDGSPVRARMARV